MNNKQPTKELEYFKKLVVAKHHIDYLNRAVDHWEWESEKKDAIIEMRDKEIYELQARIGLLITEGNKVRTEFKEYLKKVKSERVESDKVKKQQILIDELKADLRHVKARLEQRDKMVQLLEKQQRMGDGIQPNTNKL